MFRELTLEVSKYLSFDPTGKIEDTYAYIKNSQADIKNGTNFPVVVINKITKEFIGCSGIHKISSGSPELGIWIKKSAHGQGYGKEIIGGLVHWAEENLEYEYIYYPVARANIASKKVAESVGGILYKEEIHTWPSGKILDELIYRIKNSRKSDEPK